ncbi:hypothetical protein D3C71_2004420 [compost metagenome]
MLQQGLKLLIAKRQLSDALHIANVGLQIDIHLLDEKFRISIGVFFHRIRGEQIRIHTKDDSRTYDEAGEG